VSLRVFGTHKEFVSATSGVPMTSNPFSATFPIPQVRINEPFQAPHPEKGSIRGKECDTHSVCWRFVARRHAICGRKQADFRFKHPAVPRSGSITPRNPPEIRKTTPPPADKSIRMAFSFLVFLHQHFFEKAISNCRGGGGGPEDRLNRESLLGTRKATPSPSQPISPFRTLSRYIEQEVWFGGKTTNLRSV
jgi:hypothetical protein